MKDSVKFAAMLNQLRAAPDMPPCQGRYFGFVFGNWLAKVVLNNVARRIKNVKPPIVNKR